MKRLVSLAIMILAFGSIVLADEGNSGKFDLSAGYWMADGDLSWETRFSEYVTGYGWVEGGSRLEWDTNSNYILLEGGYSLRRWFGRLQYATGDIDSGTCWDTDWVIVPEPLLRSFDPSDGENDFYIVDLGYMFETAPSGSVGIFMGYQKKDVSVRMHDPLTYDIVDWLPAYDTSSPGLASTYDIEFTGLRAGLEGKLSPGGRISLKGLVAYYPEVDSEGIGHWNLRDLEFIQTGSGSGIELVGSVVYRITGLWSAELGYRMQKLEQSGGTNVMHFSDGTTVETDWDNAESSQSGIFAILRCQF